MAHVERVAGARVVHVVALVVLDEPVVRRVVDPLEAQRGSEVVSLGGVVVDDVEDDLDTGRVHGLDHALELLHLLAQPLAAARRGGVGLLRREEGEGVVAPVVAQPLVQQRAVLDELMHGHQLEGGHAELAEVRGDSRVRQPGVRAAQALRHFRVALRQSLDVRLVDDRLVVGDVERVVALPVEERVDDHPEGHVPHGVVVVARVGITEVVAEQRLVPVDLAGRGLGVGVEQQLVGVAPKAALGVPRTVDAVAVALSRLDLRQVAVPDVAVDLGHRHARLGDRAPCPDVDQAQLDLLGHLAEQREVGAVAVEGGAERVGLARPRRRGASLHGTSSPLSAFVERSNYRVGTHRLTPDPVSVRSARSAGSP